MHEYTARIEWQRSAGEAFTDNRYHRRHRLQFDGGAELAGSSSPAVVPLPLSDASAVDPEEMFVAALSSCHMLWFLSLAAQAGYVVERYVDQAAGQMQRNAAGKLAMTRVTLRPQVQFAANSTPEFAQLQALHHRAHEECFIANSVNCAVLCEPQS